MFCLCVGLLSPYRVFCRNIWVFCCLWSIFCTLCLIFMILELFANKHENRKHIKGYLIHFSLEYVVFAVCYVYAVLVPLTRNENGLRQLCSDVKQKTLHFSRMDEILIQSYLEDLMQQNPFSLVLFQPTLRSTIISALLLLVCFIFLCIGIFS